MTSLLTDTHCHLNHEQFSDDRENAIQRALDAGIGRMLVVGYDLASSRAAVALAVARGDVLQAVIGVHPESSLEWSQSARDELLALASAAQGRVAAWGEIGLDYYWDSVPREAQQRVFEEQIACARATDLPVVIHCRDAYPETLDTLERLAFHKAVLHCFTGTQSQARRAVELGLYIGVGGIATFKRSEDLRAVIADLPADRIVIETDAPYLAPQPWRGKRNEPAYVRAVAETIAQVRGMRADEVASLTSANADALFGRMR